MRIIIEVIPHTQQRLPGSLGGDWQWITRGKAFSEGYTQDIDVATSSICDVLLVRVSDMGNWRYNYLLAQHEMNEALLCKASGITTEMVDADEKNAKDTDDPDSLSGYPGSCYQREHNDSLVMEWITARFLGVDWTDYAKAFEALTPKTAPKRPTIEELEEILNKPEGTYEVIVNPDGSISAKETNVSSKPNEPTTQVVNPHIHPNDAE